jgi:DNA-binding CsgD family transcriptional regulator/PAS domain-containing protein
MPYAHSDFPDPGPIFYDAAMGEASWDDALTALSDRLGGAAFMMGVGCPRKPTLSAYWTRHFSTDLLAGAGFSEDDVADPRHNPDVRATMVMPIGRTIDSRVFVSEEEMLGTPLNQVAMLPQDITTHDIFVAARDGELLVGGFVAHRGGRELGEDERRELDRLLPHVARAFRLRSEIAHCRAVEATLLGALDSLSEGVVVVDRELHVLFANTTAEAMFAGRDGLRRERRHLRVAGGMQDRVAEQVRACAMGVSPPVAAGPVAIPRRSGFAAYLLEVFPAIGAAGLPGSAGAGAIVVIRDPVAAPVLADADVLISAFGLTPAEARVARLAPLAESKRAIAERLGLSENTVKTHLAAIRGKLGVRNMTELAQVIDRLPNGGAGAAEADRG